MPENHPRIGDTLFNLGLVHGDAERYEQAAEAYVEALAVWREGGAHERYVVMAEQALAEVSAELGDLEQARAGLSRAVEIAHRVEEDELLAMALTALADLRLEQRLAGDVAAALAELERAWTLWQALDHPEPLERGRTALALAAAIVDDDPERARTLSDVARTDLAESTSEDRKLALEALSERLDA